MTMTSISRRDCLKLVGGLATSAAILPFVNLLSVAAEDLSPAPAPLGRVAELTADIRAEATRKSTRVRVARRDEVFSLLGQVEGQAVMAYNNICSRLMRATSTRHGSSPYKTSRMIPCRMKLPVNSGAKSASPSPTRAPHPTPTCAVTCGWNMARSITSLAR